MVSKVQMAYFCAGLVVNILESRERVLRAAASYAIETDIYAL